MVIDNMRWAPDLMDTMRMWLDVRIADAKELFRPISRVAKTLLDDYVLPFRRGLHDVQDVISEIYGKIELVTSALDDGDQLLSTVEAMGAKVRSVDSTLNTFGARIMHSALVEINRIFQPRDECTVGYNLPEAWPELRSDVLALGDSFSDLADGLSVQSLMGLPGAILNGLTGSVCMVRRGSHTVTVMATRYVINPINRIVDMLAIGTWGAAPRVPCTTDYCLEVVTKATPLYKSLFFFLKYMVFWDPSGPPLFDPCGETMGWKFTVPGLMSSYALQSSTFLRRYTSYTDEFIECPWHDHVLGYQSFSAGIGQRQMRQRPSVLVQTDTFGAIMAIDSLEEPDGTAYNGSVYGLAISKEHGVGWACGRKGLEGSYGEWRVQVLAVRPIKRIGLFRCKRHG